MPVHLSRTPAASTAPERRFSQTHVFPRISATAAGRHAQAPCIHRQNDSVYDSHPPQAPTSLASHSRQTHPFHSFFPCHCRRISTLSAQDFLQMPGLPPMSYLPECVPRADRRGKMPSCRYAEGFPAAESFSALCIHKKHSPQSG